MSNQQNFLDTIQQGYATKGDYLLLGKAMLNHEVFTSADIRLPLRTLNRHGLIAGATGTGKTKTLQHITEGLSDKGIPVLLMDIKGDLSGLAQCGDHNPKLDERCQRMGINFVSESYPVELLTISNEKGARLRATVTEFGPILLSKILELNDTQQGVVAMLFKYCDDNGLPLLDLKDFKKVLQWMTNEGAAEIEQQYGKVSSATTSTILRKIIELEQQGAELFFGERSFDVRDLLATDPTTQQGMVHIMRLIDLQDRPKLFATFMLSLLAEIYATFPEVGDAERPKLVIFIDEAHLIFNEASKALLNQIETIIKLIRSKGVGIFFCTQTPTDVPDAILGQLGMKIQHALRAFTAKDRKDIKLTAQNYPETAFYDTETLLTELGIGEALITVLSEKGNPTPLAQTMLCPPKSRMGILTPEEITDLLDQSRLVRKYNEVIDRESAFEMLTQKVQQQTAEQTPQTEETKDKPKTKEKEEPSWMSTITKNPMARQLGNTLMREVTRGLLGVLGLKKGR